MLHTVLAITKPLSVKLQGISQDIHNAVASVKDCIKVLTKIRNGDKFDVLFKQLEKQVGSQIDMPRVVSRQVHRSNAPATSALEHYRINLFYPFIDGVVCQLNERFSVHCQQASSLSCLIPAFCHDVQFDSIKDGLNMYR